MSRVVFYEPKFEQLSGDDRLETYFWSSASNWSITMQLNN